MGDHMEVDHMEVDVLVGQAASGLNSVALLAMLGATNHLMPRYCCCPCATMGEC